MESLAISSSSVFFANDASILDFSFLSVAISASSAALRAFSFWTIAKDEVNK
jgi:hypothetical protein